MLEQEEEPEGTLEVPLPDFRNAGPDGDDPIVDRQDAESLNPNLPVLIGSIQIST